MQLLAAVILILALYVAQKMIYSKYWDKGLSVDVFFNKDYVEMHDKAYLVERIRNEKSLPLPVFHLKTAINRNLKFDDMENAIVTDCYHRNDIYSVMGKEKIERKLVFEATKRGVYDIENINVLVKDFFLVSTFALLLESTSKIVVFPEKKDTSRLDPMFRGILGELSARNSILEDNLTFRGIRDYQSFDNYRSINWKQSAKSSGAGQPLKVNLYDYTMDAEVRILVNLDTDNMIETERIMEESISIASSAARRFLQNHVKVSVFTNGTASKERISKADQMLSEQKKVSQNDWLKDKLDAETEENSSIEVIKDPGAGAELAHGIAIDKYLARITGTSGKDVFLERLKKEQREYGERVLYLIISPYHKEDLVKELDNLIGKGRSVAMVVPYYDQHGFKAERSWMYGWELPLEI